MGGSSGTRQRHEAGQGAGTPRGARAGGSSSRGQRCWRITAHRQRLEERGARGCCSLRPTWADLGETSLERRLLPSPRTGCAAAAACRDPRQPRAVAQGLGRRLGWPQPPGSSCHRRHSQRCVPLRPRSVRGFTARPQQLGPARAPGHPGRRLSAVPARLGGGEWLGERLGSRSCLCQARLQHHRQPHARTPQSRSQLSPCPVTGHSPAPRPSEQRKGQKSAWGPGSSPEVASPESGTGSSTLTGAWHSKLGTTEPEAAAPCPVENPRSPCRASGDICPHVPKPWAVALGRR